MNPSGQGTWAHIQPYNSGWDDSHQLETYGSSISRALAPCAVIRG